MGGLRKLMPVTAATYLVGCLAIAGVPFFSGFFSKDEVLWFAWSNQNVLGQFPGMNTGLYIMGMITAGLTAFYMFRSYFMTFEGECRADEETKSHIHESPILMLIPLVVLAVLATFGGFLGVPHVIGGPWHPWLDLHGFLYQVIGHGEALYINRFGGELMAGVGMGIAITTALLGISVAWLFYGSPSQLPASIAGGLGKVYTLIENKYFIDEIYEATVVRAVRWTGIVCHRIVDVFIIDQVLVQGVAAVAAFFGAVLKQFQSGDVQRYAAFIMFALAVILLLLL